MRPQPRHQTFAWSVFITLVASIFSEGFHHYDEHYHVLEFLAYKLGRTSASNLPWEFGAQIRSWLLPGLFYPFLRLLQALGVTDPLVWAFSTRALSALVNGVTLFFLLRVDWVGHRYRPLSHGLLCWLWFMPYIHVRASIENWSGALFFGGLALASLKRPGFAVGFLWAIAFQMRLQIAPLIAGAGAWFFVFEHTRWRRAVIPCVLGCVLAFCLGTLVDHWGYGTWTLPWWNYLRDQFTNNRASLWGTSPFWYYATHSLVKAFPPIGAVLAGSTLLSWWFFPKHLLTWITFPFVLLHSIEPHKELRFLFPMLYAVPFQVALMVERFGQKRLFQLLARSQIIAAFVFINCCLLAWCALRPAEGRLRLFRYLQRHQSHALIRWIDNDPYTLFNLPLNFYRPPQIQVLSGDYAQVSGLLREKTPVIMVTSRFFIPGEFPILRDHCERVYALMPAWLSRFNLNNWIERTRVWTVYRCALKPPLQ